MRRLLSVVLLLIILVLPVAATQTAEQSVTTSDAVTTVPEEPEPSETSEYTDMSEEFLNINIWLFRIAAVALIICTVIFIVLKIKKRGNEKKTN